MFVFSSRTEYFTNSGFPIKFNVALKAMFEDTYHTYFIF